jgi:hypothetical protein
LCAGTDGVSSSLGVQRAACGVRRIDGAQIVIGIHATTGSWDGEAAHIVMVKSRRGSWFDPTVVDATLRLVREQSYQLPS